MILYVFTVKLIFSQVSRLGGVQQLEDQVGLRGG